MFDWFRQRLAGPEGTGKRASVEDKAGNFGGQRRPAALVRTVEEDSMVELRTWAAPLFRQENFTNPSRYKIAELLSQRGLSNIYRGIDTECGASVTIKQLRFISPLSVAVFANELSILSRLNHPNLTVLLGWTNMEDPRSGEYLPALISDYVEGFSLASILKAGVRLVLPYVMGVADQLCDALVYLHGQRIVHGAIEPANVLIADNWSGELKVKLLDTGVASVNQNTGQLRRGAGCLRTSGNLTYMSPEQHCGQEPDVASDIYSWALTLLEMAAGSLPLAGLPRECLREMKQGKQEPWLDDLMRSLELPHALEQLIRCCLDGDRTRRPRSMKEVRAWRLSISDLGG